MKISDQETRVSNKPARPGGQLAVIIPSVRGLGAMPTIQSALKLKGFDSINIIVGGKSCGDKAFVSECRRLSPHIFTTEPFASDNVPPGLARNRCLDYLDEKFSDTKYVFFLDDDIVVPKDFGIKLVNFMENGKSVAAAMGRVVSSPRNYWSKLIDYSNFWWLQVEYNIPDLGWLGAGATMTTYKKIRGIRFDESLITNEDIFFFEEVEKRSKGTLGICAETTCLHFHGRATMSDFITYHFINGKNSRHKFHSTRINLKSILSGFKHMLVYFKHALLANRRYLLKRPHIVPGLLVGIFINEVGILTGIYKSSKKPGTSP
jgi:glycosyltransferase involved in cell wall biosynthesis